MLFMNKITGSLLFAFVIAAMNLGVAQTNVTTSGGIANSVPKFSGSSTIVNSVITENSGKVGIGTASPGYNLDLVGRGRFLGDGTFTSGFWVTNPTETGDSVFFGRVDNTASAAVGIWDNNAFRFTVNGLGQVFWGNLNTGTANVLNVDGSIELGGWGNIPNPISGDAPFIDFHYGNGLAQDYNARIINAADNSLSVVTASGGQVLTVVGSNVGVGTAAPAQKLDVSGNINIGGTGNGIIFPDGSFQSRAGGGTITGVTVHGGLIGGGQSGNVDISLDNTVARLNNDNQTFVGNQTINGNLRVTGTITSGQASTQILAGSCNTNSANVTNFVLKGLGQDSSDSCSVQLGTITQDNPAGTLVTHTGTLSNLIARQANFNSAGVGGSVIVWINHFTTTGVLSQTSIQCSLGPYSSSPSAHCFDSTSTASISAGDKIVVEVLLPSGAATLSPVAAEVTLTY